MLIDGTLVNDRHSNPPILSKVGLRVFFMQDGEYFDPYQISAVTIFKEDSTFAPSSILNSDELIASSVSSLVLMNFANSSADTSNTAFNEVNYSTGASGIYKLGVGQYAVVLDGVNNQSGILNLNSNNAVIKNSASTVGDYVDVWTVKMVAGSELETIFNYFKLTRGNFYTITEPIMFRSRSRLLNNSIVLGSKVDIKIANELTIENANISEEIRNTIKDSVIKSASIEIMKLNDEANLPARVTVSSFADTSGFTDITAGDTITFTWDTDLLKIHPQALLGNFGSIKGMYSIQAKYNIFNERIISPLMHLTVE
jgi:hypothetical protein